MIDIVIPNNNEAEFIELAARLGHKKLYLLYNFDDYDKDKIQKKLEAIENKKINLQIGFSINQKNIDKALQQSKLLIAKSSDKDRFFIESNKIKLIYGFEEIYKKDYIHQRASGLNHILCELAKKNNIVIGFPYGILFDKSDEDTSLLIGRLMQNISLCQKYKVKTVIGSFSEKPFKMRAPLDIINLFKIFGMDGRNIKDSISSNFY
jgi:RNase P/RNase MRP subunit p30